MIATLLLALAVQAQDSARLTLATLVGRALDTHPAVATARALRDGAAAQASQARAQLLPSLAFTASLDRFQRPMVVSPLHGLDLSNPPLFDRMPYQAGIAARWTVLDFGQRSAHLAAEHALTIAAGDAIASTEQDVIASTVHAYLAVLDARELLQAQDRLVTALHAAQQRIEQLESQGKAARVDVLRVAARAQAATADRISAESRLEVAEQDLARVSETPTSTIHAARLPALALADSSDHGNSTTADRTTLLQRAQQSSGDLRESEHRAQAATLGVAAARANWYPALQLEGAFIDRGRWLGNYAADWQVGLALSYPLFTGGSREGAVQRAAAGQRAAIQQVRLAQRTVARKVDVSLAALRTARARVAALTSAVAQAQEVQRIEQLALTVGTVVQSDYLDAEAQLEAAQAQLIEARHAEISARIDLARTLGELSPDWLARHLESRP